MSDHIVSLIRTYVPLFVGGVLTWLGNEAGIILEGEASTTLTTGVTALVVAVYYTAARLLEKVHPAFGVLLGATKQPVYDSRA